MLSRIKEGKAGSVGRFIQKRREQLGISRQQLTKSLGFISQTYIGMLERGKSPFPLGQWQRFSDVLSVPRHEFLRVVLQEKYPDMMPYLDFHKSESAAVESGLSDETAETF